MVPIPAIVRITPNTPIDTGSSNPGREGMNRVFIFGLEGGGWVCASNVMK